MTMSKTALLVLLGSSQLFGANVDIITKNDWGSGFCADVIVSSSSTIKEKWDISFNPQGLITTLWNAEYNQDKSTLMTTASGVGWNDYVKPNSIRKFGYCADRVEVTPPESNNTDTITEVIDNNTSITTQLDVFNTFNVGFGGAYAVPFASEIADEKIWVSSVNLVTDDDIENNSYYSGIKNFNPTAFDTLQQSLKNSKFLVYWLTDSWDASWFNLEKIQTAMDAGYIPVFNYWYFGDKLEGIPTVDEQIAYGVDNQRVADFLSKLNGTKFLIMEPEFNKNSILESETTQHKFASIIGLAIDTIKANTKDVYFSLAMTDTGSRAVSSTYEKCGYETCALGDKYEWGKPSIIYDDLMDKLDFISFQEMLAQFSRDPSNPGTWNEPNPIAYSNDDIGIDYLAQRISNFALFLKEKYNKPVFLPYISIATASWSDTNNNQSIEESEIDYAGWETEANNAYQSLSAIKSELQANGLFGFALMSLFDNPQHDVGGYQYFMQNEYHLGVLRSSAVDAVDIAAYGDLENKGSIISTVFDTP